MYIDLDKDEWELIPDPEVLMELGFEMSDNGFYAIGGAITTDYLLSAYPLGVFPWFSFRYRERPHWYCPPERFVIFPDEIHISHSMRNMINKRLYTVTFNRDFDRVIENCSRLRVHEAGAWLGPQMVEAYRELHRQGHALSVEVWEGDELVGGLYGVIAGNIYCGESMFSLRPGASKLALIRLAQAITEGRLPLSLIDCQFETPHLKSMGGRFISYEDYRCIGEATPN